MIWNLWQQTKKQTIPFSFVCGIRTHARSPEMLSETLPWPSDNFFKLTGLSFDKNQPFQRISAHFFLAVYRFHRTRRAPVPMKRYGTSVVKGDKRLMWIFINNTTHSETLFETIMWAVMKTSEKETRSTWTPENVFNLQKCVRCFEKKSSRDEIQRI